MYPVLIVRGMVLFPRQVQHIIIARPFSVKAAREALSMDRNILVVSQKNADRETPDLNEIYKTGTLAQFLHYTTPEDGSIRAVLIGMQRLKNVRIKQGEDGIYRGTGKPGNPVVFDSNKVEKHTRIIRDYLAEFTSKDAPNSILSRFDEHDPMWIVAEVVSLIPMSVEEKVAILAMKTIDEQMEKSLEYLVKEIELIKIKEGIEKKVREGIEKNQKQFYLQQKLKEIEKELGHDRDEFSVLESRIKKRKLPAEVSKKALAELSKLRAIPSISPEYSVVRNYLDWLIDLPWRIRSKDKLDISHVRSVLDTDHYGLKEQKERILEYISVLKLKGRTRGEVICFVGPPGSGKTSLAKSIARALGRKFVRISLGGLHDESEIRGHRRTYVGAMPGKIIQQIKRAGTKNPVFLLDEIDKVGKDWRGDPYAALMEVLDPELNSNFQDNYLELDFDLSEVLFITTANTAFTIPPPLLDRMEIIKLKGYLDFEKLNIAKRHLIPRKIEDVGLTGANIVFTDSALMKIIRDYTRESGVRELDRKIANVLRKLAKQYVEKKKISRIRASSVEKYLGLPLFKKNEVIKKLPAGVAYGLAWTEYGGEVLSVESRKMQGKGKLELTGQLGDVMKESAKTALSYIRSNVKKFGLKTNFYETMDIHIHVPEGAIPKDGPSAGVAILASMISTLTGSPLSGEIAMTGEITLTGRILPVGGIEEKSLAAKRSGIKTIFIPLDNKNMVEEMSLEIKRGVEFIFVENLDDFIKQLFDINAF